MKTPIISAKEAIKVFEKIGYKVVRQKGSHIRMPNENNP
ncbi:MAG TPA: type II toxin-antitoxin system HicA family toxin [Thermodesulfobacteriota bacterium]|nr:type II toxin-antitoxin system HicA family toxin [Thermodesulfobacteriota bacterium]